MTVRLLIIFISLAWLTNAQTEDAWVYFIDKPNATAFLDNPLLMLNQRSLDRRMHHQIPIDITDVPIHQPYVDGINALENLEVLAHSKWFNCVFVRGELSDIQQTTSLPFVSQVVYANKFLNAEPFMPNTNPINQSKFGKPVDLYQKQHGAAQTQINIHDGQLLHQDGFKGQSKLIAVLDSGFFGVDTAPIFQHLFTENRIVDTYNFVNRNDNPYINHNHGTLVLSTIATNLPDTFIGTAPEASYLLFVTEDVNSETTLEEALWVEAAELADALGADIINTSLGYNTFDNPNHDYTYDDMNGQTAFITKGSNMAFNKGMLCVASAGNSGNSPWQYITAPADAPHTLTVGAIDADLNYVSFSSIGPTADGRTKPDVMALGSQAAILNTNGELNFANGTSFSAPITSGLVACLWQALPQLKNHEILALIKASSSSFTNPTAEMGFGIPCFYCAYLNALGVSETNFSTINVYPNPFKNQLTFDLTQMAHESLEVTIYNALSQKIYHQKNLSSSFQINLEVNSGLYFFTIKQGHKTYNGKIIKN